MKKLYKKGKVHPSPPPPTTTTIIGHLSFLPATILSLTVALSPEDREVLAYLISCYGSTSTSNNVNMTGRHRKTTHKSVELGRSASGDHDPMFQCNCFGCYTSFWARWDSSPNRQLIHEILEEYEEGLFKEKKGAAKKKKRGKRLCDDFKVCKEDELSELDSVDVGDGGPEGSGGGGDAEVEKGSLRRIVSFIGERVWKFWNLD
ncbi:hypothetical protein CFOL_v3_05947 [Cephalotus follicularis]|uniref:Uncharacterized protein n=1 Tax=Cephalotus follicularis TaxID=3775 RepID=A0A1Q3B3G4_CEPFO|nr:hypothetical protein CFOL_v3_05947 [Cephalotus follicularis]